MISVCRGRGSRLLSAMALVLLLAGCGGPRVVPLSDLAANAEDYDGRAVVAHGVVVEFGDEGGAVDRYFVMQDHNDNRVQLLPDEAAEPHVGSVVEVVGEFEFDPDRGRLLHVESIEAVTADR